jgi:hypothetical protein
MDKYYITIPDENLILCRQKYFVNNIIPLAIRILDSEKFLVLFLAGQDNDESNILLQVLFSMNSKDEEFIKSLPLFIDNLVRPEFKQKFDLYVAATKEATTKSLYMTDFEMKRDPSSLYFLATAVQNYRGCANVLDLHIPIDNFVIVNLFLNRLSIYDRCAEYAFGDKKLKNVELSTAEDIKLDGSSTDFISRFICNHYTCRNGKQFYKFNFVSAKDPKRKLKKPIHAEKYDKLFINDFTINDMIFCEEKLYLIYEQRSDITEQFKKTILIVLDKELYDKTNLIDFYNIYEEENNSNE